MDAINESKDLFIDNIRFPLEDAIFLRGKADGFASLSNGKSKGIFEGTVAAGDGVVFKMQMPTNGEVNDDVKSYFNRKGYYACAK